MNEPRMTLQFSVNGSEQIMELSPTRRLLDILRLDLGLTGPKEGCSIGRCGACSVLVDGQSTPACCWPASCKGARYKPLKGCALNRCSSG